MKELLDKTYNDFYDKNVNEIIDNILNKNKKKLIVTSNSEIYMYALKNEKIKNILLDKDAILIPDSIAVEYAIKKAFNKKVDRTPGVELVDVILEKVNNEKKSVYLYGASKEANKGFNKYINEKYKDVSVVGAKNGYIKNVDNIKKDILEKKPDVVFAALGMPKQEMFLYDLLKESKKGLFIGVGGSFDVLSGQIKRAPKLFIKLKLEWLYRIIKEPKRIKRFVKYNIRFILLVRKRDKK